MKNACLIFLSFISINVSAQIPADLPWPAGNCNETSVILHRGVAPATCGTLGSMTEDERYTFGMISVNGAIPNSGRVETTNMDSMYHHPTWTVDLIGTPFGVTINTRTAETFLTASTNWGSGYMGQAAVINHGSLGGANQVEAGGAIYRIDAVTGEATLFTNLPQQSTTINSIDCENGNTVTKDDIGVGLGNIAYDEINDQYFVTNIEDGRIYRIDAAGTILDSFDPFTYDDGVAGISILTELPYGVAIEPNGGNRLLFGLIEPTAGNNTGAAGAPAIYSIDLTAAGAFVGTVDNSFLHPGATYDNYVGTETLHTTIPTGSGSSYTDETTYNISDLEFDPDGNLLVGVRVSCYGSFFGSYNHWGETNRLALDGGTQLYTLLTEYDISELGDAGNDDNYGGVASYTKEDGTIVYVSSSADILEEAGPHGLAIWEANATNAPLDPLGAFSYGAIDSGDPKGAGGDVDVFTACKITCTSPDLVTMPDTICANENIDLAALVSDANNIDGTMSYYNTLEDAENLSNAISETFNLLVDASFYIRKDAVAGCFDIESLAIVVNNVAAPTLAGDQTICINNDVEAFTISNPAVADGDLSYQWQSSTMDCMTDFMDIDGATADIYASPSLTQTTYFRVITNSTLGNVACNDTSNCVVVSVNSFSSMRCVPFILTKTE